VSFVLHLTEEMPRHKHRRNPSKHRQYFLEALTMVCPPFPSGSSNARHEKL
jgi:hypothetical protein